MDGWMVLSPWKQLEEAQQGMFQRLCKQWGTFKYEAQLLPLVVQFHVYFPLRSRVPTTVLLIYLQINKKCS